MQRWVSRPVFHFQTAYPERLILLKISILLLKQRLSVQQQYALLMQITCVAVVDRQKQKQTREDKQPHRSDGPLVYFLRLAEFIFC